MKSLLISAAIVCLATPRLWAGSITKFQPGEQGGVLVPVALNGHGPFLMLIDTGSTHSVVTERVVAVTGARAVARSHVLTPTDTTPRLIVVIDELSVGPNTIDLVMPSVVPDDAFGAARTVHGLIGQDVLAWLRYTLDFKRGVIEWHDRTPSAGGVALRLAFEHGRFLLNLPQQHGTLRLVPDSGAGGLVLWGRGGTGVVDTGRVVQLSTASSRGMGRQVLVPELRLGSRVLRQLPAVVIDRPNAIPPEGDGLLPLHLFDRVTFDGPGRVLIVG